MTPDGLARAQIRSADVEALLEAVGARFVLCPRRRRPKGRTWDNAGRVEDVATGSAAGPAGAYLVRHGLARAGEPFTLRQGRFVGRPSAMRVTVTGPVATIRTSPATCGWSRPGRSTGSTYPFRMTPTLDVEH